VAGLAELRGVGQYVGEREVEVAVGVTLEFGRHRMRAEPRRHAAGGLDRPKRRELGLAIEPVAGLRLERCRAVSAHPVAMSLDRLEQAGLAGGAGRANGRE